MNVAAVIPAAGRSLRMGPFKPLLPLGDGTVIERVIGIAREGGVGDIVAVLGYGAERLNPVLERHGVRCAVNTDWHRGMFSSVQEGVRHLDGSCPAFFLLLADMPLVRAETLKRLLAVFRKEKRDVCYPCYRRRRGHPPLISTALVPDILAYEGNGGLRALLSLRGKNTADVDVDDPGILIDLNVMADYERLIGPFRNAR